MLADNARYDKYLPQYMAPSCECRLLLDFYQRKVLGEGYKLSGEPYKIDQLHVLTLSADEAAVQVTVTSGGQEVLAPDGSVVQSSGPASATSTLHLRRVEGTWQVLAA